MNRFLSILTVILFLPVALVPAGFMPAALADGEGYLMLCPSTGDGSSTSDKQTALELTPVDHHAHHQSHSQERGSIAHDDMHEATNEVCDYASLSVGQDLIQTPRLALESQQTRPQNSRYKTRILTFSRLTNKQSRAPPL